MADERRIRIESAETVALFHDLWRRMLAAEKLVKRQEVVIDAQRREVERLRGELQRSQRRR